MTAPTVWVHTESQGDQWRVLGVYASPHVLATQPLWEDQGGQAFARIRDDGWTEWLEPTEYDQGQHVVDNADSNTVPPRPIAPARSPWARPVRHATENGNGT